MEQLYTRQDEIVRAVRVRSGKNQIKRAVQHLFPLELQCNVNEKMEYADESKSNGELDINTREKQLDSTLNIDTKCTSQNKQ